MSQVRVHNFAVSLDGFGAGAGQSMETPFGHAQGRLMGWFFPTRAFQTAHADGGGTSGVDDAFASNWGPGIGAEIMVGTSSAPSAVRGPITNGRAGGARTPRSTPGLRPHPPPAAVARDGGWDDIPLHRRHTRGSASTRAGVGSGQDIRIGGGVDTVREFLAADLIDHLHIALVPIVLGRGERLWDGLEDLESRFEVEAVSSPSGVTHLTFTRKPGGN